MDNQIKKQTVDLNTNNLTKLRTWLDPRYWSLTAQLTITLILLLSVTLIGIIFITLQTVRPALTQQIGQNFEKQAINLNNSIKFFFLAKLAPLTVLVDSNIIEKAVIDRNNMYTGTEAEILAQIKALDEKWLLSDDNDPFITNITNNDPAINLIAHELIEVLELFANHSELFITDRYGATIAATGQLSDYYQADESWWQASWNDGQGAVFISDPVFDESAQVTALLIAIPIYDDETEEVIGILRSTLNVNELFDLIAKTSFGKTGHAMLLDRSGNILFDPKANEKENNKLPNDLRTYFMNEVSHSAVELDSQGKQQLVGHAIFSSYHFNDEPTVMEKEFIKAVVNLRWISVIQQTTTEAFSSVNQVVKNIVMASLVSIIVVSLVSILFAKTITQPILKLSQATEKIGAGNLNTQLPPAKGYEIGRLTSSFRKMTTELKTYQEKLVRQEKLAVLGQLSGSVGHELRNPLGVISNAVYFLEMVLADSDETTQEYLQIISTRVKEADKIVADLLNLSRNRTAEQQKVAITELINETLARHPVPDSIQLNKQLPDNLPTILVDPQQIQQVLSNLTTNAYQAMPNGGELTITSEIHQTYLHLSITDTGHGMSSETLEKIFEPLFTTKAKGIGLGLVVCKNLVEINKGHITAESTEGKGSTFTLMLPIV